MKKALDISTLDSEIVALPRRDMMALVNVFITNVLNGLSVTIPVQNNHIAVEVCAVVSALNTAILTDLTCSVKA